MCTTTVSLLNRTRHWRHRFGGFGVIVVDDADEILQCLSVAYLDEAVAATTTDLEDHFGRRVQVQPVFLHPGEEQLAARLRSYDPSAGAPL